MVNIKNLVYKMVKGIRHLQLLSLFHNIQSYIKSLHQNVKSETQKLDQLLIVSRIGLGFFFKSISWIYYISVYFVFIKKMVMSVKVVLN